jgi:signal transduction histidine kinase
MGGSELADSRPAGGWNRAGFQQEVRDKFVDLMDTEFRAMAVATVAFITIGVALSLPGLLLIAGFGFISGSLRQLARRPAAKGDLRTAVFIFTAGLWATTVFIVAILPIALPVMVFNLVVPFILAATYLNDQERRPVTIAGVVVAGAIGILGLTQDGLRIDDGVDERIVDLATIGFLVGYTWMFTATVRDANRTRIDTLERALAANDAMLDAQSELRRSRRRLVEVADQERGRIERNIHDGAQQRLVSAALQLKLAGQLADRGQAPTAETLELLHDEVTAALAELRELAQGIYPSLLAERGLVEAVGSLCRRSTVPARVEGDIAANLDRDTQAAIYFFCAEALQNANKHAGPDAEVTVTFGDRADAVEVVVSDTGRGFSPADKARSRGILNMVDRIEAIDGTLTIRSAPGSGASLRAVVAIEPDPAMEVTVA